MRYQLLSIQGPSKGLSWPVTRTGLFIGQAADCGVLVAEAYQPGCYCRVYQDGQAVRLEHLVNQDPVLANGVPTSDCLLTAGDVLAFHALRFQVESLFEPSLHEVSAHSIAPSDLSGVPFLQPATTGQQTCTPQELAALQDWKTLYDNVCELGASKSLGDLLDRTCQRIRERFNPAGQWIVRNDDRDNLTLMAEEIRDGPAMRVAPPMKALSQAVNSRCGIILPGSEKSGAATANDSTLAVPLLLGDVVLGAVAIQLGSPVRVVDSEDLRYLVLLARSLAPMIAAMETIEQLHRDNERLRTNSADGCEILGDSRAIAHARSQLRHAAKSNLNVLVTGETGTGKELAARMVHRNSDRHAGPLVIVNCAAIPRELFENELFGHEEGAFTGAQRMSPGLVVQADFGTLFLDEVGDLCTENQARILRVVETGTYRRVGGEHERHVDIRVIAASNRDLQEAIRKGQFREDLYQRLGGFEVHMPSLRERPSDVQLLAEHFFRTGQSRARRTLRGISPEAVEYLRSQTWPGNVRELRNSILRAISRAVHEELKVEDFTEPGEDPLGGAGCNACTLAEVERQHIEAVLHRCGGHVGKAAQVLGIARSTLYEKLYEYGIQR